MIFSQTAEYALRAVVALAEAGDTSLTTKQIAERAEVPANYLSKLLHMLGKTGLIEAQRGVGGGFRLSQTPESTSVLDIINLIDPIERIHECPLKLKPQCDRLCPLHRALDDTLATIESNLGGITIGDLVHAPSKKKVKGKKPRKKVSISIKGKA